MPRRVGRPLDAELAVLVDQAHLGMDVTFKGAERAGDPDVLALEGDLDPVGDGDGHAPDA
jgi:hypothetical protein